MKAFLDNLRSSIRILGLFETIGLFFAKRKKASGYRKMLQRVQEGLASIDFRELPEAISAIPHSESWDKSCIDQADRMLKDENLFFTFPYATKVLEHPWNFDPVENRHWPFRHYSERALHASDTPRDVKIVWEINRFKDLPVLAQAAAISKRADYVNEIERRITQWIEENPFADSINWASALEIGIRLLSWTASIEIVRRAGFQLHQNVMICESIWQQIQYLFGDLSTDKVVRTNHLIGEAASLFVASSFWEFREDDEYRARAKSILESEILSQTFEDGSTRESSTWYHGFVTDFFDIASRVGAKADSQFSAAYLERLSKMKSFRNAMVASDGSSIRIGDCDDGVALGLPTEWIDYLFGTEVAKPTPARSEFLNGGYVALDKGASKLVMRCGKFGMGGDGFSSHAHDDILSPVIYLEELPVLTDPGTFVYNGMPEKRSEYRKAEAHNGIIIGDRTSAVQKLNFGWKAVRPDARIISTDTGQAVCEAETGEWKGLHRRRIQLWEQKAQIEDILTPRSSSDSEQTARWYFHLDPRWKFDRGSEHSFWFTDGANELSIEMSGRFDKVSQETYNYSPSYLREEVATCIIAKAKLKDMSYAIQFSISKLGN